MLDEDSPVEARPLDRDEYLQTKQVQEQMVRDFAARKPVSTSPWCDQERSMDRATCGTPGVLRVGGSFWLGFGRSTVQKLTYVENCAEAIVLAAERPEAIGTTLNIVDDDLPTRRSSKQLSGRRGSKGSAARSPCRSGWCGSSPMWPTP
ncbi:MAG: hypothetical protein R2705_12385 [Ilumatobacteraceae bacterium]